MPGDFKDISTPEVTGVIVGSAGIGVVRFLYLIRLGRSFKIIDLLLEPALAIFGGMLMWALNEYSGTPDILQTVMVSLGAWGGPRTIHMLEKKYLGGTREGDPNEIPVGPPKAPEEP